jgi:hypothetical protein
MLFLSMMGYPKGQADKVESDSSPPDGYIAGY